MLYRPPKRSIFNPFNIDTGPKWERRLRLLYIFCAWNALGTFLWLKLSGKYKKLQEAEAYLAGDGERTGKEELELEKNLSRGEMLRIEFSRLKINSDNWNGVGLPTLVLSIRFNSFNFSSVQK